MNSAAATAIYSLLFLLAAWSLGWMLHAGVKLYHSKKRDYYYLTHIVWALVNIAIAVFGFISVKSNLIDDNFASMQRNIIAFNVLLDIGYILLAKRMRKSSRKNIVGAGKAVMMQGAFLLVLDSAFATILTLILL